MVKIRGGMQPAHGAGLDGTTPVKSLKIGQCSEFPGKYFVQDADSNAIHGTADELFVAAKAAAQKEGYLLTSTKISGR